MIGADVGADSQWDLALSWKRCHIHYWFWQWVTKRQKQLKIIFWCLNKSPNPSQTHQILVSNIWCIISFLSFYQIWCSLKSNTRISEGCHQTTGADIHQIFFTTIFVVSYIIRVWLEQPIEKQRNRRKGSHY